MYTGDWHGLYRERWGEDIVPGAYAHPAKFARGLIRRIYEHLIERGYLKPGDSVVDPFAGVALGALEAMRQGCHWYGMELEQKFVDLGRDNLALWEARYRPLWPESWGTAKLYQGDSRELSGLLREAGAVVSSPPWAEGAEGALRKEKFRDPEAFAAVMSSRDGAGTRNATTLASRLAQMERDSLKTYGDHPANLGNMRASDEGLQAVVSSPPFGEGETRDRSPVQAGEIADCITRAYTQDRQGSTPGNLAHLETTAEGLQAVVSSPPFENATQGTAGSFGELARQWNENPENEGKPGFRPNLGKGYERNSFADSYGEDPLNLGNDSGDDFWHAARQIVDECYKILTPGAVAVWVVKRFVRNKEVVPFPDQWRQMCEAAGFVTLEWIRAWVVEEHGEQLDLFGGSEEIKKERKSFFRRLYESKYPENAIDWEDVLIMRRVP